MYGFIYIKRDVSFTVPRLCFDFGFAYFLGYAYVTRMVMEDSINVLQG